MARVWKRVKNYERWVLIGIVIILLATFSIAGVSTRGCQGPDGAERDLSGSYEPLPGRRIEVSATDYAATEMRYSPIYLAEIWGPSVRYAGETGSSRGLHLPLPVATWMHIVAAGAAREGGYQVGDKELAQGIEDMVLRALSRREGVDPRDQGARFSPEIYDQVVQVLYKLPKADFETAVREMLLKDKFLSDVVDLQRFSKDPQEAYESWKASRERVDLAFAAVPAAQFAAAVDRDETTRTAVGAQADRLRQVVTAVQDVLRVTAVAKEWRAANGDAWPADAADLVGKEPGKRALSGRMPNDPWGKPLTYERTGDGVSIRSLGPDGEANTPDDVTSEVADVVQALAALRRTGDALVAWRSSEAAWPAALADLTKPRPVREGAQPLPALLSEAPTDPWGHALSWRPDGPTLASVGPDGTLGTADDVAATVSVGAGSDGKPGAGVVRVPVPARLAVYVLADSRDAWSRPLEADLTRANPLQFAVSSLGADGAPGTPTT